MLTPLRGKERAEFTAATRSLLCPDAFLSPLEVDEAATRALAEDLGRAGDITSIATVPEDAQANGHRGRAQGRCDRRTCRWSRRSSASSSPEIAIAAHARDGDAIKAETRADDSCRAMRARSLPASALR